MMDPPNGEAAKQRQGRRRKGGEVVLRVIAFIPAFLVLAVTWFPLEFVRAGMTEGLPERIQFASMGLPILIAVVAAAGYYRRLVRPRRRTG